MEEKLASIKVSATTGEEPNDRNATLQQTITHSVCNNSENGVTFISSIILATLFSTWVAVSTVIIVLLFKLNNKLKHEPEMANCNVASQAAIDTSENVAYGMFLQARNYL